MLPGAIVLLLLQQVLCYICISLYNDQLHKVLLYSPKLNDISTSKRVQQGHKLAQHTLKKKEEKSDQSIFYSIKGKG